MAGFYYKLIITEHYKKGIGKMIEGCGLRQRWHGRNKWVMWNILNACADCKNEINNENEASTNISQDQIETK